jgi:hypothetical protein
MGMTRPVLPDRTDRTSPSKTVAAIELRADGNQSYSSPSGCARSSAAPLFDANSILGRLSVGGFSALMGVANCYAGFEGAANVLRPLPDNLDSSAFRLIQPAPQHLQIALFGHRIMKSQWGDGCDLYLRP